MRVCCVSSTLFRFFCNGKKVFLILLLRFVATDSAALKPKWEEGRGRVVLKRFFRPPRPFFEKEIFFLPPLPKPLVVPPPPPPPRLLLPEVCQLLLLLSSSIPQAAYQTLPLSLRRGLPSKPSSSPSSRKSFSTKVIRPPLSSPSFRRSSVRSVQGKKRERNP